MIADGPAELIERRWFATNTACAEMQMECEFIRQSIELGETAYQRAQARLRELEQMREALGQALAEFDAAESNAAEDCSFVARRRRIMNAA